MPADADVREIIELVDETQAQKQYRERFLQQIHQFSPQERNIFLKGTSEQDHLENYSRTIAEYLDRIDHALQRIIAEFETQGVPTPQQVYTQEPSEKREKKEKFYLSKKTRKRYFKEIGANEKRLKEILHPEKQGKKEKVIVEYTVYSTPLIGRIANIFCKGCADLLSESNPKYADRFSQSLRSSGIKMLSRTYINTIFFISLLAALATGSTTALISIAMGKSILLTILSTVVFALLAVGVTALVGFMYPSSLVRHRRRQIKNDLPFALIHMSAVAGSGAKPEAVFRLIASSGEYKGIESEIKKIVNYINLFGYDMSTALKTVARTTPSPEFRDLLNGLVATIESGGALKSYLKSMAEDTMNSYALERQKYVQMLSTYSDIYTAILIAAPLLFMVTLAIINSIGGEIGGVSVKTISFIGVFIAIPLLNILYLIFLNIVQPEL